MHRSSIRLFHKIKNIQRTFSDVQRDNKTSFGYKNVEPTEKQGLVNAVFSSVASKYDIMNDLMSGGAHRIWKSYLIEDIGILRPNTTRVDHELNEKDKVTVLDVATGTGDIAYNIIEHQKKYNQNPNDLYKTFKVIMYDINFDILEQAKHKARDNKVDHRLLDFKQGNAEDLSAIPDKSVDIYVISFGLRNVPDTRKALKEAYRVLKPGGRFVCMEFSKVENAVLSEIYRFYSFNVIPLMGQVVAGDRDSYQYLVESIDKFYTQEELLSLIKETGFEFASYQNLTFGAVAIHTGFKIEKKEESLV